jgi:hypothetical protein
MMSEKSGFASKVASVLASLGPDKQPLEVPSFVTGDREEVPRVTNEVVAPSRGRIDPREYAQKIRANRKDFSGLETKMKYYGENPGWKRRWVNEDNVPGRIEEGYRFVQRNEVAMSDSMRYGNQDMADRVSTHAGTDQFGKPYSAFLMEIPDEIANELNDQKSYDKVRLIEKSIRSGTVGNPSGNDRVGTNAGLPEIKLS